MESEFARYARHAALDGFGKSGHENLAASAVAVVGAGGVGGAALQLLASSGVGRIFIVDKDSVSLSNLGRQTLYAEAELGLPKASCAASRLSDINPNIEIFAVDADLFGGDCGARKAVLSADMVVDATDSFASRLGVAQICAQASLRVVVAAAQGYVAQNTLCAEGFYFDSLLANPRACEAEKSDAVAVFAPAAHAAGVMAAGEVIRALVSGFASYKAGLFYSLDMRRMSFFKADLSKLA